MSNQYPGQPLQAGMPAPTQSPAGYPQQGVVQEVAPAAVPAQGIPVQVPLAGQPVPMPLAQPPQPQPLPLAQAPLPVALPPVPGVATSAATPHGPDIPTMGPPDTFPKAASTIQPRQADPEEMYPEARSPQIISQETVAPTDIKVVDDQIVGNQRIVTIAGPNVERVTDNEARMMAWQQRVNGGWINAGIEYLDMYPVGEDGNIVQNRLYNGLMTYHSRWRLTVTA